MARNDWYSIREEGNNFIVEKIDPDDRSPQTSNQQGTPNRYSVGKEGANAAMCDCFAGHKFCRHKKMVVEFQKLNRIGQRWIYNYDKSKWLPPLTQQEP